MKTTTIFQGAATAIITPITRDGVDFDAFGRLIDWQIESGIDALVVSGTTGESSTMTDEEHRDVIAYAVKRVAGRVPVIAGTGSNDTDYAVDLTRFACQAGADAALVVTPYYNKATQKGLVKMYSTIADASSIPLILYNVPSRTGVNIEPATFAELADHPMISGIKEAGGNISKVVQTRALVGDKLDLYSGNDDQVIPLLAMGGKGVISVLSNVAPKNTHDMVMKFMEGDLAGAARLQLEAVPLINALFCEVNPIPVKTALNLMGWKVGPTRMPLCEMEPENEERLKKALADYGIKLA